MCAQWYYDAFYGIILKNDPDYSGALLQANPYHATWLRNVFPTGEMFQPLAHFLLKVGQSGKSWHLAKEVPFVPTL